MPKKGEWPEKREIVIGTVTRVNPYSAFISLEEYPGKEGMIHISEVAGKWVRDIREFVKTGKKVVVMVMNVDKEKDHIALSLKRVKKYDAEEKMREYKRNIKAEKMLDVVAKKLNMSPEDVREKVGTQMQDIFGEVFKAFQMSLTDQGYDLMIRKGFPENWAREIKQVAKDQMELKEVEIKGILEVTCLRPDGVEIIKKLLKEYESKYGITIKYISAPKYSMMFKTKDAKLGEKKLREAADEIIKNIKSCGEGSFKVE